MKDKLKILFVIPVPGKHQYISFGIGYLTSYLKKYADKRMIIKLADENSGDDILKIFLKEKPDIIGITASTPQIPRAEKIATEMKRLKSDCFIVFGGIHASVMPDQTLRDCSAVDLIVIGEGEETLRELSDLWIRKKGKIFHELDSIPGLAFRRNGEIYKTKSRELISEIDKIPPPDREIFNEEYYLSPRQLIRGFSARRSTSILTSRGCPYSCKFCASNLMAKRYRAHSVKYIMDEIKHLIEKYKIESLYFHDDLFIANKERTKKICEYLIKSGLNKKIKWACQVRTEIVLNSEDILDLIKKAGCVQFEFGFESGNDRMLKLLKGDSACVADNQKALDLTCQHGIKVYGNFMFGNYSETIEEMQDTIDFIEKNINKLNFYYVYAANPLPGTAWWKKELFDLETFEYDRLGDNDKNPKSFTNTLSDQELKQYLNTINILAYKRMPLNVKVGWFLNEIFKRPGYIVYRILSFLEMAKSAKKN